MHDRNISPTNLIEGNPFTIPGSPEITWNLLSFLELQEQADLNLVSTSFHKKIKAYHAGMEALHKNERAQEERMTELEARQEEHAERQIKVTKNHWDIQLALELKKTTEKVKEQKNEELAALQIEFSNEKKALAEEREAKKTEAQKKHQTLSYQLYWDNLNSRINLLENFIQKVTEEKQSRGFFYGRLNQLSSPEVAAYRQQFNEDFLPGYFIVGSSTGVMTAIAIEALAETAADTALANGTSASAAYNAVWASILGSSPALSCILIIAAGILAGLLIFLCVRELSMRLNFKKGPERFDSHQIGFFSKKALQKAKEISVTCGPYDAHLSRELGLQTIENKTVATVMNLVSTEKERLCSERDRLKFFHSPAQQPREAGEVKDAPDSPTLVGGLGFD